MRRVRTFLSAALLCGLTFAPPAARADDLPQFQAALAAATAQNWAEAEAAATQSGPIAQSLVDWHRLRAGQGSFADYVAFVSAHGDWPGLDVIYRRGEAVMGAAVPAQQVVEWFASHPPETGRGALIYVNALTATGHEDEASAELARIWLTMPLDAADENALIAQHRDALAPQDEARVFAMLDHFHHAAAERALDRIAPGDPDAPHIAPRIAPQAEALARARIALQSGARGVDAMILALPAAEQADAGLAMDRFRWRVQARRHDLARELLEERSTSAEALRRPEIWAPQRVDHARALIREGAWAQAETVAAAHFLEPGGAVWADLEFLAGYAALRGGAQDRALSHFQALETGVGSPISISRALYWQGRAHEAAGDEAAAQSAYERAATHQAAFYGQVAAERIGAPMDEALSIPGRAEAALPQWRRSDLRENSVFQAGVFAFAAGYPALGQRFFLHLSETAEPDDIARMARLTMEMHYPYHALRLAKRAAGRGAIYPAAYFPLTGLEEADLGLPPELVMSIARQESEFNPTVASHAGAQGLMQVMPGTAQDMAARLGLDYDLARLTQDAHYNARLGAEYLRGLRASFGPSSALVAAGYNAGPGRSRQWTTRFGDIRTATDPIDWVEMIPFDETRNYVMRVTEALPVYRARIAGAPVALTPLYDLSGGGEIPAPQVRQLLADTDLLTASRRPPREGDAVSEAALAFDAFEETALAALATRVAAEAEAEAEAEAGDESAALSSGQTRP